MRLTKEELEAIYYMIDGNHHNLSQKDFRNLRDTIISLEAEITTHKAEIAAMLESLKKRLPENFVMPDPTGYAVALEERLNEARAEARREEAEWWHDHIQTDFHECWDMERWDCKRLAELRAEPPSKSGERSGK